MIRVSVSCARSDGVCWVHTTLGLFFIGGAIGQTESGRSDHLWLSVLARLSHVADSNVNPSPLYLWLVAPACAQRLVVARVDQGLLRNGEHLLRSETTFIQNARGASIGLPVFFIAVQLLIKRGLATLASLTVEAVLVVRGHL